MLESTWVFIRVTYCSSFLFCQPVCMLLLNDHRIEIMNIIFVVSVAERLAYNNCDALYTILNAFKYFYKMKRNKSFCDFPIWQKTLVSAAKIKLGGKVQHLAICVVVTSVGKKVLDICVVVAHVEQGRDVN